MSRRKNLIRDKYLAKGKTVEDFLAGKRSHVLGKRKVETEDSVKAMDIFLKGAKKHATSRPINQQKADRLRAALGGGKVR